MAMSILQIRVEENLKNEVIVEEIEAKIKTAKAVRRRSVK